MAHHHHNWKTMISVMNANLQYLIQFNRCHQNYLIDVIDYLMKFLEVGIS